VSRTEDDAREGELHQLLGIVLRFEQRRQALLAQPLQLGLGKRRPRHDVGHDRQRGGQARHGHVQIDVRRVGCGARAQVGAEEVDRVRDPEGIPRPGAFVEHVGGQAGQAEPAGRIRRDAGAQRELQVHGRHLVHAHDPHREAVRERPLLDRRQVQRRRRTDGRRLRTVGRLLRRDERGGGHGKEAGELHFLGSTTSSTRRVSGRNFSAAAWMSSRASAR
jgi:hypothetical protein